MTLPHEHVPNLHQIRNSLLWSLRGLLDTERQLQSALTLCISNRTRVQDTIEELTGLLTAESAKTDQVEC